MKILTSRINYFLVGMMALTSCIDNNDNFDKDCLTGSGATVTETRTVSDFNSISTSVVGNVFVTQGSPQSLRIETHANVMNELRTEVNGNELEIDIEGCMSDVERLDVFITIPEITGFSLSGVGTISMTNDLNTENLFVNISGVGHINLQGEVGHLECALSGVGDLNAFDLDATTARVAISGVGNASVTVLEDLEAIISGAGNLRYRGNPTINATISGAGGVSNAN